MTKQEEMRIWGCDMFRAYAETPRKIANAAITDLAFNANKSFGYLTDPERDCIVVVGVNKPDDLPLLGIVWEDLGAYKPLIKEGPCGK